MREVRGTVSVAVPPSTGGRPVPLYPAIIGAGLSPPHPESYGSTYRSDARCTYSESPYTDGRQLGPRRRGIAAEGQLGEDENSVLPLNEGAAYFALRAGVPLVPVAVNGTRWLRFGKPIRVRVGQPIAAAGRRASHASVDELTAKAHRQLSSLVRDYPDQRIPGPFGRWLTDVFSERPWRDQAR